MWFRSRKLLVLAVVVAVVGFACGGDDVTPTAVPAPTQAPTAVPATPTPSAEPTSAPTPTTAPTAVPTAEPQPALLEVRVTDAPPDGVSKILLTVQNIQVNVAEGLTGSGWETVVEGPISFDLVAITGVEEILGSAELPPGRYNQVRLDVTEALITVNEEEKSATLPSGKLRIVGGFDVTAGETTVLTLDFDAARSVVLRDKQDPILKPVVKLLVRRSGQPISAAETISEPPTGGEPLVETVPLEDAPTPAPTATPPPEPAPTATSVPGASEEGIGVQDSVEVVREISVVLTEFTFTPSVISIQAGEKVRFTATNAGNLFHTFTFQVGDVLIDLPLQSGETKSTEVLTFDEPATNPFWCQPHQFSYNMVGTITVGEGGDSGSGTTTSSGSGGGYGY